jgi:hypothetical protein
LLDDQQPFKKRQLRVTVCGKRTKRSGDKPQAPDNRPKMAVVAAVDNEDNENDDVKESSRGRERDSESGKKRERSNSAERNTMQDLNALNATKRIKLKVG